MQTTQHNSISCRVYIHPAACNSPSSVDAIQRLTGRLAIITTLGRIELAPQADETTPSFGGAAA